MAQFAVGPASVGDARAMAELFAAVAGERDGIATEPPVGIGERAAQFARTIAGSVVAVADSQVIGMLHVEATRHGFGEIGMLVDRGWRGRGVGSALVRAAIGLAREQGLHKLCLEVFAATRRRSPCTARAASSRRGGAPGSTGGPAESCGTQLSWAWRFRRCPRTARAAGGHGMILIEGCVGVEDATYRVAEAGLGP